MKSISRKLFAALAVLVFCGCIVVSTAVAASEQFTGEVSDAMCGAKHAMSGSKAECARACVRKGSSYALVVGDKVYTLKTDDKAALAELDKLAGEKATVAGTADGDAIAVSSVSAAK